MMMQNFKTLFVIAALTLPLLALSACQTDSNYSRRAPAAPASGPPVSAQTPSSWEGALNAPATQTAPEQTLPEVKVGILLPLSGQHKQLGTAMLQAAQMALFDIGHTNFKLIPRDTKGTPDGASAATRTAVNDGAQIILGPVFAGSVRAAKPITRAARINMIAFSTDWSLAGGNTYIMGFLPFDQVDRLSNFAAQKGISRVGVLAPASDYGRVVSSAFNKSASANNIAITSSMNFPPGTSNLAPIVRGFARFNEREAAGALSAAPFEAVLLPVGGQDARNIGNLLTHYELPPRKVRRLGTGLFDEAALASESNLEGTWFAAPSPNTRSNFENRFTSIYGTRPPRLSTLAFDATALTAVLARRGLETTGRPNFDRPAIANANGFSGLDGIFRFGPNNIAERGLAILEFRRGKIIVIDEAPKTFQSQAPQIN